MTEPGLADAAHSDPDVDVDVDWVVVGSGFGGAVAALRLAEKGYRVVVLEQGRRYGDDELPASSSDRRSFWAPRAGLRGVLRPTLFRHVASGAQTGVGGGSLVYGGVLFRAQAPFYGDLQWRDLGPWEQTLRRHYETAEHMLGARTTPWESRSATLTRELAEHFGGPGGFGPAPMGVFFGDPSRTVPDPYFGGAGPDRRGCRRCGQCMIGCRHGAVNTLTRNYLWFAERLGVRIVPERAVVDIAPRGALDGSDGYRVVSEHPGPGRHRDRRTTTARGVVVAAGAVGTNQLLAECRHRGSLPRLSDRLGELVRTNSEVCLAVLLPDDQPSWQDVTTSSRAIIDGDTQVELLTYGPYGDLMRFGFTTMVGGGPVARRLGQWVRGTWHHPGRLISSLRRGWSSHALVMLVMQARDNALRFRAEPRRFGRGIRLVTEADPVRPAPRHLEIGRRVAEWVAEQTGGVAQSSVSEALADTPLTAHVIGGAAIGADATRGVVDRDLHAFGYRNLIVCDASALPANPGVNPALTITALAEHAMAAVPAAGSPAAATSAADTEAALTRASTGHREPFMTSSEPVTSYAKAPTRTIAAAGVTFTYRELGPTGGVPVVFLVHLAATLDNWDPRIVDAVAAGHHVIAVDNRGVGASTGSVPSTVEAMADDAYAFVTALGFDTVDVVGFSLGGFVAQILVERHPDLVRRMVLTGTGPRGGKGIANVPAITFYDITRAAIAREDPRQFLFFNRNPEGRRAGRAFVERTAERTSDRDTPMAVRGFLTQLVAIVRWGLGTPQDLSAITVPTLIANGDHDRMVPSVLSQDLHRRIPDSELIIYPDSGHGGVFQHHEAFASALVEFLDRGPTT